MQSATFSKYISPGVYQVKETGGMFTVSVDRLLADGTMLSSPENGHLLSTIDAIVESEYPAAPSTAEQQGTSVAGLVSNFSLLVQWMKVRGYHYFSHLTSSDLHDFLYDSACGLDVVLRSQERILEVIEHHKSRGKQSPTGFLDMLAEAGLPPSGSRRLPAAKALFESFATTGKIPDPLELRPQQVTTSALFGRARPFQLLWEHRDSVADGLSFLPSVADIAKCVKKYGKPLGSTRTLPINYVCELVGLAFTWVYEYGPLLAELLRVMELQPSKQDESRLFLHEKLADFNVIAASKDWSLRLRTTKSGSDADTLNWFVAASTFLPIACFIICGIFTARRMTELISIQSKSLSGNRVTGYWHSSYVGKRAMNDDFPCTQSVADAIRALAYLKSIRGIRAGSSVFAAIRGKGRLSSRLRNALKGFGALVQCDLPGGATHWSLAAHQFRRMFALIYRWRYDHPSLIALSVHFGHMNLKQIKAYTSSKEWMRDNQEAGRQFTLEKVRDIALGKVEPKGILGKSLHKAISRRLAQVELVDEDEQDVALNQLISDRQMDLRATQWGYCGAKGVQSNLRRAACSNPDVVRSKANVDPETSSEDKCAGCMFFLTDISRRSHWMRKAEHLRAAAGAAPEGSMAQHLMSRRSEIIERFARNNFTEGSNAPNV